MYFAENNRISHRQLYRQVILAFGAPFLLCLLGEQGIMGVPGMAGMGAALVALAFYVIFLIRVAPFYGDLRKTAGKKGAWAVGAFFLVYIILASAYLLSVLETVVPESLLIGVPGWLLSFAAVFVCSIGTHKGMQRRGRIAEVSGAVFLGAVVLMIALSIGQARLSYLQEMWGQAFITVPSIGENTYRVLCAFSGIGLLPFALCHVEKNKSASKSLALALLTLGALVIVMLFLLPAVFGWERLLEEPYPILPLLAGANLPGNVLARFDVLWMGVLLYSLLFSIGSLLSYGHQVIRKAEMGTGRFWVAAAAYGLSLAEIRGKGIQDYFFPFLAYIFVPGLVAVQLFLGVRGKGKRKKLPAVSAILCLALVLSACSGVEPEKRMYPLAVGIDVEGDGFALTYGMPDLPQSTGQEKPEENGTEKVLSINGKDFQEIDEIYSRSQEKYLDMGHVQVVLFGKEMVSGGKWEQALEYLKNEPFIGENIYVFWTDDVKALMEWQGGGSGSVGEYLTALMEKPGTSKETQGTTLRQVYYGWYTNGKLTKIPQIILENDKIQVMWE